MNETIDKKSRGATDDEVNVGLWKNMIFYKSIVHVQKQRVTMNQKLKPSNLLHVTAKVRPVSPYMAKKRRKRI